MNSLRNVIALLWLIFSTAASAQNIILVGASAGAAVDSLARNLGTGLRTSLGKQYSVTNVVGEYGARAVREFSTAPADGSHILVVHATVGHPVPDVGGFVPLAVIAAQFATYQWIGVFAPQGTPAAVTMNLERAVLAAVNSPGFGQQTQNYKMPDDKWVGAHLTPGSGATLAGLVAQSGGGGSATNAPTGSPGAMGSSRASAASGSYSLGGTVGGLEIIALAPPPGVRSRNECMKVEWITSPIAQGVAGDLSLIDPQYFGNGTHARDHMQQQKHLVVYNTCAEDLAWTVGACSENTMLKSGEHVGTFFETDFIVRGARTNVRIRLASEHFTKSDRGEGQRVAPKKVFVGAWLASDLSNASGLTDGGASRVRKVQALLANARIVLGMAPGQNVGGKSWPPGTRLAGVKSCSAFSAEETWNATR